MSTTVTLNIPVGSTVGTPSDVSAFGSSKTFIINGISQLAPGEQLVIEGSGDPTGTLEANRTYGGVVAVDSNSPGQVTLLNVANTYRVRRVFASTAVPTVTVSADPATQNFVAVVVPANPSGQARVEGVAVDVSTFGDELSLYFGGTFQPGETVLIEGTQDGTSWNGIQAVNNGYPGVRTVNGTWNFLRAVRGGAVSSLALTTTAAFSTAGSGGGFPGYGSVLRNWVQPKDGVLATVPRADHQHSVFPQPDSFVVYCVDYDGIVLAGNDTTAQPGYAPSTGVPATDMTTALTAAKLTPFKTLERVGQLLPRWGNNATVVVLVRPRTAGATYLNIAGAIQDASWCEQVGSWKRNLLPRPTLDFVNDINDKIVCGFQISTTGFASSAIGYNCTAGATALALGTVQINGGGAPGFPVEALGTSAILGKRIRFDNATTTVALRNATSNIWRNTAAGLVLGDALPAVPVAADIFYVEEPGLRVGAYNPNFGFNIGLMAVGFRTTSGNPLIQGGQIVQMSGIETSGSVITNGANTFAFLRSYNDELGTTRVLGISHRIEGASLAMIRHMVAQDESGYCNGITASTGCTRVIFGSAAVYRNGAQALQNGTASPNPTNAAPGWLLGNSSSATRQRTRITATGSVFGGMALFGVPGANIRGVDTSNQTIQCINAQMQSGILLVDDVVSTDGGNTDVVLDVSASYTLTVIVGSLAANTVTATLGDVRLNGGVLGAPFSGLVDTNYMDTAQNNVTGAVDTVSGNVIQLVNASGGTIPQFSVVRQNGVTGQMTTAQADTVPHASGVLGVCITQPLDGALGIVVQTGPVRVNFDIPPTGGAMSYVYDGGLAGLATTTLPATIQVPLGYVEVFPGATSRAVINLIASPMRIAATGVLSVTAGTGITVTGTATNPIVNNAGVLSVTAGTNITVTGTAADPIINATELRDKTPFMSGAFRSGAQDTDTVTLAMATAESVTDAPGFPVDVPFAKVNFRCVFENYTNTGTAGNLSFDLGKNGAVLIAAFLVIAPGTTGHEDTGETAAAYVQGNDIEIFMKPGGSGPDDIRFTWDLFAYN